MRGLVLRSERPLLRRVAKLRGFTILELLAVMFIVMIMAGIVVPVAVRGIRHSRMRSAASQVASGLRRARNLAIASGEIYCARFVALDPPEAPPPRVERSRVDIYQLREDEIGGTPTWSTLDNEGRIAGGVNLPRGAQLTSPYSTSPLPVPPAYVMFLPDGSAWAPEMLPPGKVRVALLWVPDGDVVDPDNVEAYHDVTVSSLSGRIIVSERVRVQGP